MNKKSLLAIICCLLIGVPSIAEARRYRSGGYRRGGYSRGYYGGHRRGYYGGYGYRRSSWWPFWGTGIYVSSTANQREIDDLRARVAELEAQLNAVDRPTRAQYRTQIRSLNNRIAELELEAQQQ